MMVDKFKLVGLYRPQSFTCEPLKNENIFWVKNGLGLDKFNELWDYCKWNWKDKKIAIIQFDGFKDDGTPNNPVVIEVMEAN